jgi:hypothetical protein
MLCRCARTQACACAISVVTLVCAQLRALFVWLESPLLINNNDVGEITTLLSTFVSLLHSLPQVVCDVTISAHVVMQCRVVVLQNLHSAFLNRLALHKPDFFGVFVLKRFE